MGLVKQEMIEAEERGWASSDLFVCDECVEDVYLKTTINEALEACSCDFCGRGASHEIAASVDVVMELVAGVVGCYYNEPTQAGVPWDEGEWALQPIGTEEVLMSLPLLCNDNLFDEIQGSFTNDCWVQAADGHWASSHPHEVLIDSWSTFSALVKYQTRFHFNQAVPEMAGPEEISPGKMLIEIGRVIQSHRLIISIPPGQSIFRARSRSKAEHWDPNAENMGAPPSELATSGRMNPAGISYLYTSLQPETAVAEIGFQSLTSEVFVATFNIDRPLWVVDLSMVPGAPSIFDLGRRNEREQLIFLNDFVSSISKPISKGGAEHIEYVPTQVVSEYLAQAFQPYVGTRLDGILFRSAVHPSGKNLVLFPSQDRWPRKFDSVSFRSICTWPIQQLRTN